MVIDVFTQKDSPKALPIITAFSSLQKYTNVFCSVQTVSFSFSIHFTLIDSYIQLFEIIPIVDGFKNTLLIEIASLTVGTFTTTLSAFAFGKLRMPFKKQLFFFSISGMMIPYIVVMIPQYRAYVELGLVDTLWPLIIPAFFGNIGFFFFLVQYLNGISKEYFEAAKVDGASYFTQYAMIMVPLCAPAIAVQVISWFLGIWNDVLGPDIYLESLENKTLQVMIKYLSDKGQGGSLRNQPIMMAAAFLSSIPILVIYVTFQKYFMKATFAGNFVESWGYRVGYSTLTASSLYDSPFVVSADSVVLLDTLSEQHGLGHCTTTIGPNLDSYYMAYHTIDKDNVGFYREYNLNRVSYTRNRMSVNHALKGNEMPEMPAFYVGADGNSYSQERADTLTETGDKWLSSAATGDVFTAEYNFKNVQTDGSFKLYFGSNDYYVTVINKTIQLKKGNELIASGTLVNDFDFSKLHQITVSHKAGRIAVKFDDLTKIDTTLTTPLTGGKIGYAGVARADIGATTFSGYAFGSSDETEASIVDGSIWADNYMPEQSKLTGESGVKEIEYDYYDDYSAYSDTNALSLKTVGDYVTYKIDVNADGYYGIDGLIDKSSFDGVLGVQVDNAKPLTFNVGKINFSDNDVDFGVDALYVKKQLGELSLTKGIHTITFILAKGEFTAVSLDFYKSSEYAPSFSATLDAYVLQGSRYYSQFALADGAHFSDVNLNRLVMFGTNKLTDYTVSVDVKLTSEPSARRAGLVVRLNNPNYPFEAPGSDASAMQGYFIYFDDEGIYAEKLNYSADLLASAEVDAPLDEYHKLEVVCKGNSITVYLNGAKKLNIVDSYAYTHGGVGLFSVTTEVYYKNLKIS